MSSSTRKIAEAIDEHGSLEAYLAWLKPSTKIPMCRSLPPPPPPGRMIREGGRPTKTISKIQPQKFMDFKIITVEDLQIDLLIRRDFTDQGEPCVVLEFFAFDSDDSEYQHVELVEFESPDTAKKYVRDFSPASAKEFVESNLREQPSN